MTATDTAPESSSAPSPDAVLSGVDISVRFGGVSAVNQVSIDAYAGKVLGLIGPNGAGKTTLFDTLSGIRPPTEGRVFYEGVDITKRSPTWRSRHGIRRTFQRQQMFGWLTVEENVLVALEWRGGGGGLMADLVALPTRKKREKARAESDETLELCGLVELRNEPAGKLPIGRARMVEMARALVDKPKVLLLDEPTSGIEESDTVVLGEAMTRAARESGCAVVLVEHDVGFVMAHCDHILALNLGSVLAFGTPEEIRQNRAVQDAYLG